MIQPQLVPPADEPPIGDDWIHELKWDGFRIIAAVEDGRARLSSRGDRGYAPKAIPVVAALDEFGSHRAC